MPVARAENYEYELPEGYTMDPTLRQRLDALVDEAGMDETLARRFVALHVELVEDYAERLAEANGGTAEYAPELSTPEGEA